MGGLPIWAAVVVSAILVAIAVVVVVSLARTPNVKPAHTPLPTPTTGASAANGPVVVFLGDSYTTGVGSGFDGSWARQATLALGWQGQFLGAAGTGYIAPGSRGQGTYVERVSQVIAGSPDKVVVSGGCNDMYKDLATLPAAAATVFQGLRSGLPDAEILVVLPWCGADTPADYAEISRPVTDAATAAGVRVLDTAQPLAGHPEWLLSDGVAPNATGHKMLADAFVAAYRALPN